MSYVDRWRRAKRKLRALKYWREEGAGRWPRIYEEARAWRRCRRSGDNGPTYEERERERQFALDQRRYYDSAVRSGRYSRWYDRPEYSR